MLDILWFILIIYLVILGINCSHIIKFRNYKIFKILKQLNHDSLYLSLGTKMGVGTIIGTTISIFVGGAGSLLWIYIFTLITSSLIYVESYLGNKYKQKTKDGYIGGVYYYTKYGLNKPLLAIIILVIFITTYSFFFLMIQANTIYEILDLNPINFTIILLIMLIMLVTNKTNQITKILNKIVPIICTFFIIISIYVVIKNYNSIPIIINNIFTKAFSLKSFFTGMIIGIKRSIFLNELLIGTTSMSSGINNKNAEITANTLTLGTYFITFIASTLISLLVLIYLYNTNVNITSYNELLKLVFTYHFGSIGNYFLGLLICLLATTTIISGIYIGISNISYVFKSKKIENIFKAIMIIFIISGIYINTSKIWLLIDIMMLLLIIINSYIITKLKNKI